MTAGGKAKAPADAKEAARRALERRLEAALPAMRRYSLACGAGDMRAALLLVAGEADRSPPSLIVGDGAAAAGLAACLGEALVFVHMAAQTLADAGNTDAARLLTALDAAIDEAGPVPGLAPITKH